MSIFDPVRVIQCPSCNETIDASAEQCRFCSASFDPGAAEAAADAMGRLNQACSDASNLRSIALAIPVFWLTQIVPFFGMLGLAGFYGLAVTVPILALRWWVRFGRIQSGDPDWIRAKRTMWIVGILTSLLLCWILFRWVFLLLSHHR